MKHKSRVYPFLDLDISYQFTKTIHCNTSEHVSMIVEKLDRIKEDNFGKIKIPEFDYKVSDRTVIQTVEYIKGRKCAMLVKKYRDRIYNELVEKDREWTFCDFNYDNFIVLEKEDLIYAIDFQSYSFIPNKNKRKELWREDLETNNLVLEYITRELPFRKDAKLIQ